MSVSSKIRNFSLVVFFFCLIVASMNLSTCSLGEVDETPPTDFRPETPIMSFEPEPLKTKLEPKLVFEPELEEPVVEYSPGGKDWSLSPTEEETSEWKHEKYLQAMHDWAKPQLDKWKCQSCGRKLNEDFRFASRSNGKAHFKCKCNCPHEFTIDLDTKK